MTIHRIETTVIPQTNYGRKFAKEYVERLKKQGVSNSMRESTVAIFIEADYWFDLKEEQE